MNSPWFWIIAVMALANVTFALNGHVFNAFCALVAAFVAGWMMGEEE